MDVYIVWLFMQGALMSSVRLNSLSFNYQIIVCLMLFKLNYEQAKCCQSLMPLSQSSSVSLCVFVYQECNRRGLARDHVIMFESQSLWRAIGVPWEGVRQWFCLLLLCLLHLPLFLPGQCWNTPTCSHSNCWSVICFVRWSLGPTEELTFIWFCAQKVAQWRDTVTTHMTNWWL